MGWFSKKVPVYSTVGTELHRLLTQEAELWELNLMSGGTQNGIHHLNVPIYARYNFPSSMDAWTNDPISLSGETLPLTEDDKARLWKPTLDIQRRLERQLEESQRAERERRALATMGLPVTKPNTFDADCCSLARAVLKGDRVAARALADRVQELSQEGR